MTGFNEPRLLIMDFPFYQSFHYRLQVSRAKDNKRITTFIRKRVKTLILIASVHPLS